MSIREHISPFGVVSMAQRLRSSVTAMHLCAVLALYLLLFGSRTGQSALTADLSQDNDYGISMSTCALECDRTSMTVERLNRSTAQRSTINNTGDKMFVSYIEFVALYIWRYLNTHFAQIFSLEKFTTIIDWESSSGESRRFLRLLEEYIISLDPPPLTSHPHP